MALQRYQRTLQRSISSTDSQWIYSVPDLPAVARCNQAGLVKSLALISNTTTQEISLRLTSIPSNRAISGEPLDHFVHVTLSDFRLQPSDPQNPQPVTARESAEYVTRFLKAGLIINGVRYSFYGHSNSQLKSRSCFLLAGSKDEVGRKVEGLGDFSKITSVAKKAKRIGLLFSTAHSVMEVASERCRDIADVENENYIFTDGCGLIALGLARQLVRKRPIVFRNHRYLPAVFQIRYRGYKGVVTLEPQMQAGIWLELRKSMRKFTGTSDLKFAVVEYSKVRSQRTQLSSCRTTSITIEPSHTLMDISTTRSYSFCIHLVSAPKSCFRNRKNISSS
jgi:RNA dependent RNA polymerase